MKQTCIAVSLAFIAVTLALGQAQRSNSVEAKIIALEKQAWEAWRNKDTKFFQNTQHENFQFVSPFGVATKAQFIATVTNNHCSVKGYSLDNTKVTMLNNDTALLTYSYTQDVVCDGKPEPSPGWASTVLVKRAGKWLAAYHQDTPANPTK